MTAIFNRDIISLCWRSIFPALVILLFGFMADALAQEKYPNRPITIVAPFPPGGVADLMARPVGAALENVLKNPVVVANKNGRHATVAPAARASASTRAAAGYE